MPRSTPFMAGIGSPGSPADASAEGSCTSPTAPTWLGSVARNYCIDHYRASKREKEVVVEDMLGTRDALRILKEAIELYRRFRLSAVEHVG